MACSKCDRLVLRYWTCDLLTKMCRAQSVAGLKLIVVKTIFYPIASFVHCLVALGIVELLQHPEL